ncbi:hypothetical protein MTR67_022001 [Solanum verrucosum]|uniref:Uncharacterized protein n=1 Tax=Solanum verrucosum TaxID=315347 RepID=A0AAF0QY15_SOLVR|nr:hypothetical protein MTR67_022001 [Solanum verrucosum]
MLKLRRMDLHATFMEVVQQLREGVEIEEDGSSCHMRMNLHATFMQVVQQLGEGVEIEEDGSSCQIYASCATLVKVSKSRRMDLHATFMQVVQQFGEGVTPRAYTLDVAGTRRPLLVPKRTLILADSKRNTNLSIQELKTE